MLLGVSQWRSQHRARMFYAQRLPKECILPMQNPPLDTQKATENKKLRPSELTRSFPMGNEAGPCCNLALVGIVNHHTQSCKRIIQTVQKKENRKEKNSGRCNLLSLPDELLVYVASYLHGTRGSFLTRLRLAAVCQRLRVAVFDSILRLPQRRLEISDDSRDDSGRSGRRLPRMSVNGIALKPKLRQQRIGAFFAFAAPNELRLSFHSDPKDTIFLHVLATVPPLSLTHLSIGVPMGRSADGGQLFASMLRVVTRLANLKSLSLEGHETTAQRSATDIDVAGSPFDKLRQLRKLEALRISDSLLPTTMLAELLNRMLPGVTHLCCKHIRPGLGLFNLLEDLTQETCSSITSVCCVGIELNYDGGLIRDVQRLLEAFPRCQKIACVVSWQAKSHISSRIDAIADAVIDYCSEDRTDLEMVIVDRSRRSRCMTPRCRCTHDGSSAVINVRFSLADACFFGADHHHFNCI